MLDNFFNFQEVKRKLFVYMGSKDRYLCVINKKINESKKDIYVEPFLGSGVVLLNLERSFKEYHVAEKNLSILNIFKQLYSLKDINVLDDLYNKYYKEYSFCTYDGFYSLRDYFNKNLWNTNSLEECFVLVCLISCTINNMCRFGPNGYNTCFGARCFTKFKFAAFKEAAKYIRTYKNLFFYENSEELYALKNSIIFLDPPYYLNPMACYEGWGENNLIEMLNKIDLKNNNIIYTDIKNKYADKIFEDYKKLDSLKNISPNRKQETKLDERMYFNF